MAKTIAIVNQKGGVGKTTTCVNLAAALSEAGQRVLLCDFDPQANSTSGMGVDKTLSRGIYQVLIGESAAEDTVVHTRFGDVLPSNKSLAGAGIELITMDRREFLLQDALNQIADRYDYIFIDCPPSLELLTLNALCAADEVIIPVRLDNWSIDGVDVITEQIEALKALNSNLKIAGILLTDYKKSIENEAAEEWLRKNCKYNVFSRRIRHSEKAVAATYYKQPIETYSPRSAAATDYRKFMEEYTGTKKA